MRVKNHRDKKIFIISFIVIVLLVLIFVFDANKKLNGQQNIPPTKALNLINQEREKRGLQKLETDENLCILAKLLAEDSELAYPKEINERLSSNIKYKNYLKDFPIYITSTSSMVDMWVKFNKYQGKEIAPISDEQIARQSLGTSENKGPALSPTFTHGCTYASSGKNGFKPFGYLVAGAKNTTIFEQINFLFNLFGGKPRF